jgi:hypothetical protein
VANRIHGIEAVCVSARLDCGLAAAYLASRTPSADHVLSDCGRALREVAVESSPQRRYRRFEVSDIDGTFREPLDASVLNMSFELLSADLELGESCRIS